MRRSFLITLTILVLVLAVRAGAQLASPPLAMVTPAVSALKVTPDLVITRLMSFDRNGDGRVVRSELPERMHDVLSRGDTSKDQALDRDEVRALARRPAPQVAVRGFQPGVYGFGGTTFDTRLHIEGAIDDLRLAADTREKALAAVHAFKSVGPDEAKAAMLKTMAAVLTDEQLEDFVATALNGRPEVIKAFQGEGGVTFFGANANDLATQKLKAFEVRMVARSNPATHIERYNLAPAQKARAVEAIHRFRAAQSDQMTESDRALLVERLKGILDDEQREDLRAALDRRPIVKQTGFTLVNAVRDVRVVPATQPGPTFQIQNLLLTK